MAVSMYSVGIGPVPVPPALSGSSTTRLKPPASARHRQPPSHQAVTELVACRPAPPDVLTLALNGGARPRRGGGPPRRGRAQRDGRRERPPSRAGHRRRPGPDRKPPAPASAASTRSNSSPPEMGARPPTRRFRPSASGGSLPTRYGRRHGARAPPRTRGSPRARRTQARHCPAAARPPRKNRAGRSGQRARPRHSWCSDPRDAHHGVTGDERGQFFLGPALGPGWPLRQHHVPDLRAGVVHPYLHLIVEVEAELAQHLPRLPHYPGPVSRILAPGRRQPEHGPRITRTQGAHHHVVHDRRVLQ